MGELVPIGDIAFDLPGVPAKALSDRAPQARQHFTRLDQLVDASAADARLAQRDPAFTQRTGLHDVTPCHRRRPL